MAPTRVILMSCGSYNPPTNMHLRMFEIARDHLHRLGTHVVVGGVISPVHDMYDKKELASATHRCAMLRLALQNSDWIKLSTWETRQNCWTKTRMSLQHHQNLLNSMLSDSNDIKHHLQIEDTEWIPENVKNSVDNTPIQIKLLCGADLLESFGVRGLWLEDDIDAIVGEHGLVVITREGSNPNRFIYDSDILSRHMNNICIVTEWIPNEVSSTRIRRALKRGESVRYLLQDSVIDYIYKHEIYDARMPDTTIFDKTCMPTIRQIVDYLVATHPIRACGPRLLLSAINPNQATNDFNQDASMAASNSNNNNNNDESAESYENTRNPYHDHSYI
ncbi:nicotinamide/nicotinic acid mononucleotide adenylyltransferase 1 isoform X4 [Solenopsis invicta]|uniref:nicotinamide/nicotinic acid mononucleotide adenylyltransferase 1 isoform X4 n=1 Tax=Solenopsis invicta TaxID=13686 RepID=UPI00193D42A5|nr:nicotinamide/nicotinic acid mononucleotide adenylyltransferase 1 isoform X4 [Solenopsis invicta]